MKITKTKKIETITEEIEILNGTYYFSYGYKGEEPYEFYKVVIENEDASDVFTNIIKTKVRNSYQDYLIAHTEDYTDYFGSLIEEYFKGEWNQGEQEIKEISAEEFEQQKQEVIKRITEKINLC